jgi:hypothetical protein
LNNIKDFIKDQLEKGAMGEQFRHMSDRINELLRKHRYKILPPADMELIKRFVYVTPLNYLRFEEQDNSVKLVIPHYYVYGDIIVKDLEITGKIRDDLFSKVSEELGPENMILCSKLQYYYRCEYNLLVKKYTKILNNTTTTKKLTDLNPEWEKFLKGVKKEEEPVMEIPAEIRAFEQSIEE